MRLCRKKVRRAKAQLEHNLIIAVKDNKIFAINASKGGLRKISTLIKCRSKQGQRIRKRDK